MQVNLSNIYNNTYHKMGESFGGVKSENELKQIDENIKNNKIDDIKTGNNSGNKIYFESKNGISSASISDESLDKLKSHFDSKDFYKREDGSIILNGNAEKYISGWFSDIAYARGYVAANKNNNDFLNKDELLELNVVAKFSLDGTNPQNYQSYQKIERFLADNTTILDSVPKNIDEALNQTILSNSDFDDTITLGESEEFAANKNPQNLNTQNTSTQNVNLASNEIKSTNVDDEEAKKKQEIANALSSLTRIKNTINTNGVKALSKADLDKLEILNIDPNSLQNPQLLEKFNKASDKANEHYANFLNVDKTYIDEKMAKSDEFLGDFTHDSADIVKDLLKNKTLDKLA
ncbi:hypothetical protein [Campylobacter sp. RM12651]|uniref:hypothetical protein n=1 Tax=Campylobacter sp. RM12651 TaxID=1660079 RepID=UPI001EFAD292|nr:hypothetical protein [Campylobacter sp. RM12651]ULO04108.1 hypothetical protein AVBRAN_1664 [Campylobacter sp. RM12651]